MFFRTRHECVEIFHVNIRFIKNVKRGGKLTGRISDLYAYYVNYLDEVSVFSEYGFSRLFIVYYQTQNSEILSFRDGKSSEINVIFRKNNLTLYVITLILPIRLNVILCLLM